MSSAATLTSRVVDLVSLGDADLAAWEEFCRASESLRRAFLTPHFASAVQRARGGVRVTRFERDGVPTGFLPFQYRNGLCRLLGVAEPAGGDMADGFALVAREEHSLTPEQLLAASELEVFEAHHLVSTEATRSLSTAETEPGLRVRFGASWDAYWESIAERNKKFVQKTERRQRNIIKEHGPLRLEVSPADGEAVLEDMIRRKREQYARTGAPDALEAPWKRALLTELLHSEEPTCRGELYTLHAGDTWVATHFGLRCLDVLHYWFPVYSHEVSRHSPGHLLLKAIGERCNELGIEVVDRGAGDTQAKRSFANEEQSFGRDRWTRAGLRSTLYRAGCSLAWRLQGLREGGGSD